MNKTDLMELKKRWKIKDNSIQGFSYTIFSTSDGILHSDDRKFYALSEEECLKYLSFLAKGYSTATSAYNDTLNAEGDLYSCFEAALSAVSPSDMLSPICNILTAMCSPGYYALLMFSDSYDIPDKDTSKTKTGESSYVYNYASFLLCPIKPQKGGIAFTDNDLTLASAIPFLQPPVLGIIYPAYTDRQTDSGKAFVSSKSDAGRELISSLFSIDVPKKVKPMAVIKEPVAANIPVIDDEVSSDGYNVSSTEYLSPSVKDDAVSFERSITDHQKDLSPSEKRKLDDMLDDMESRREFISKKHYPVKERGYDEPDDVQDFSDIKEDRSRAALSDDIVVRSVGGKDYYIIPADKIPMEVLQKLMSEVV